jgi:hypothetical protein
MVSPWNRSGNLCLCYVAGIRLPRRIGINPDAITAHREWRLGWRGACPSRRLSPVDGATVMARGIDARAMHAASCRKCAHSDGWTPRILRTSIDVATRANVIDVDRIVFTIMPENHAIRKDRLQVHGHPDEAHAKERRRILRPN